MSSIKEGSSQFLRAKFAKVRHAINIRNKVHNRGHCWQRHINLFFAISQKLSNERGQWLTEGLSVVIWIKNGINASNTPPTKCNIQTARFGECYYSQRFFWFRKAWFLCVNYTIVSDSLIELNINKAFYWTWNPTFT